MCHAKLFPIDAMIRLSLSQMHQELMTQLSDRDRGLAGPMLQQLGRRRIAQQIECIASECQRWKMAEKLNLCEFMILTARSCQHVGEGQVLISIFQVWFQFSDLPMEGKCLRS